ncbi:MAG: hypothetical protein K8R60_04085 [Burkholderiales bacterium]|nr:hypothetical protein [Burkholderiales bacterium]
MTDKKLDWTPDLSLPVGKGATYQRFTAEQGQDALEITTTPWGEGDLKVNGEEIARAAEDDFSDGDAFRELEEKAEAYEANKVTDSATRKGADAGAAAPGDRTSAEESKSGV